MLHLSGADTACDHPSLDRARFPGRVRRTGPIRAYSHWFFYRIRVAGFLAWFIFIGPGVAEFTHFIFPLLKPAISPELAQNVSHMFPNGAYIPDLSNYIRTTGTYYFAGMYTAVLPMIPGIYPIYRIAKADGESKGNSSRTSPDGGSTILRAKLPIHISRAVPPAPEAAMRYSNFHKSTAFVRTI